MNSNKIVGAIAVIALVIAIVGLSQVYSVIGALKAVDGQYSSDRALGGFTNYDQLALGSTTPGGTFPLVIGNSGATTTIFADKLCLVTKTVGSGSGFLYYYPATSTGNAAVSGWATTTTSCM